MVWKELEKKLFCLELINDKHWSNLSWSRMLCVLPFPINVRARSSVCSFILNFLFLSSNHRIPCYISSY